MRKCKDCKHKNALEIEGYLSCPFRKICVNNDRTMYQPRWYARTNWVLIGVLVVVLWAWIIKVLMKG